MNYIFSLNIYIIYYIILLRKSDDFYSVKIFIHAVTEKYELHKKPHNTYNDLYILYKCVILITRDVIVQSKITRRENMKKR